MPSLLQPLEPRTLLSTTLPSTDPGHSPSTAFNLHNLSGNHVVKSKLTRNDTDTYRFRVNGRGNVNLTLGRLQSNASLTLLNRKGKQIAQSNSPDNTRETLSRSLKKGTYHVRVSGPPTRYTLELQADRNHVSVRNDGESENISLLFHDGSTRAIQPNRETWIVIHGWQVSPRTPGIDNLASALDARTRKDQVLILDWSGPASESSLLSAADWVPTISKTIAKKLRAYGLTTPHINIAGHSLGGYMTDAIAASIPGGANRLIALDPATLSLGGIDFTDLDYAGHSRFSLAFIGSTFSSPVAAYTADETIEMEVGPETSLLTHSNVVHLFAEMVRQSHKKSPDPISSLFSTTRLSPRHRPNYKYNAFGDYEAELVGRFHNGRWLPQSFTYRDDDTRLLVRIEA